VALLQLDASKKMAGTGPYVTEEEGNTGQREKGTGQQAWHEGDRNSSPACVTAVVVDTP